MVFDRVGGFIGRYHLYRPKTTNDKIITLKWSLVRSSAANEVRAFGNIFYVHFSASYGLKHIKICVTRDWNVDRKRSNTAF